jgi:hypothetical protein
LTQPRRQVICVTCARTEAVKPAPGINASSSRYVQASAYVGGTLPAAHVISSTPPLFATAQNQSDILGFSTVAKGGGAKASERTSPVRRRHSHDKRGSPTLDTLTASIRALASRLYTTRILHWLTSASTASTALFGAGPTKVGRHDDVGVRPASSLWPAAGVGPKAGLPSSPEQQQPTSAAAAWEDALTILCPDAGLCPGIRAPPPRTRCGFASQLAHQSFEARLHSPLIAHFGYHRIGRAQVHDSGGDAAGQRDPSPQAGAGTWAAIVDAFTVVATAKSLSER